MSTVESYERVLLALAIWREARGQSREAKAAVKHVVLNRAANPRGPFAKCPDVVSNILQPAQFSSFNRGDANAAVLPNPRNPGDWKAWLECCAVVDEDQPDPVDGSNYYFSVDIPAPSWAAPSKFIRQIGAFRFFRL